MATETSQPLSGDEPRTSCRVCDEEPLPPLLLLLLPPSDLPELHESEGVSFDCWLEGGLPAAPPIVSGAGTSATTVSGSVNRAFTSSVRSFLSLNSDIISTIERVE